MLEIAQRDLFALTQATKENYGMGKTLSKNEMMNEFRKNELERIVRAGSNIDPTVTKTFWRAVKYGDVAKVRSMVANGFVVNQSSTLDQDQTLDSGVLAGPVTVTGTQTVTGTLVII